MKKLISTMLKSAVTATLVCSACTQPQQEEGIQLDDAFKISTPVTEVSIQDVFNSDESYPSSLFTAYIADFNNSLQTTNNQYSIFASFMTEQAIQNDDPYYGSQPEVDEVEFHEIARPKVIDAQLFASTFYDIKAEVKEASKHRELPKATKQSTNDNSFVMPEIVEHVDMSLYSPMLLANIESSGWLGEPLSKSRGSIMGPSGKETYYNLPMDGVIRRMRELGFYDDYWVRVDGAKMLGPYVMVAANLQIRPKGTIVETSLGLGIVADTGAFAKHNVYQLDIAVAW